LEVDFSVPASMSGDDGPGTKPEQLFAVGYAACFQSAPVGDARGRKLDATGSQSPHESASARSIPNRSALCGVLAEIEALGLDLPEIRCSKGRKSPESRDGRSP
jgi:hypothetical protein